MKDFKLTSVYHKDRPLSWSAISSFEWNPRQWYTNYVLKEKLPMTEELIFGSYVDKRIQSDPTFLPELVRYPVEQHKMSGTFDGIPLIGYADAYRPMESDPIKGVKNRFVVTPPAIRDYKTGRKPWNKKRADETGQLTMYLLMLWLKDKIRPEDVECYIDWLPTHQQDGKIVFIEPVKIHTFKTKRTMQQVVAFGQRIKDRWAEMEAYALRQADVVPHVKVKNPLSRLLK